MENLRGVQGPRELPIDLIEPSSAVGERELHRDERKQKRRLASVDIRRHGQTRSHFPDIVIWPPGATDAPAPSPERDRQITARLRPCSVTGRVDLIYLIS
jgi:hypothetical protein